MDQIHLKELDGEIGKILGYYSFGAWIQLTPYLNSEQDPNVTAFHEATHRDLCFYTSVGQIELVLASIIRNNPKDYVGKIAQLLEKLNISCWNTHEGVATFTSYLNVDPDFQTNIEKIRSQLPGSYCFAFDYFHRVFLSSLDISICKVTKSYVLFNVACAAMSGKHYFHTLLPGHSETKINPNPDQILVLLVTYMEQKNTWRKIYGILRDTYNRLLGKDYFPEGSCLDIRHFASIDSMVVTEAVNTDLRSFFAGVLVAIGIETYKDGHEWHNDRDEWVDAWKLEFHNNNLKLTMPLVFQRPGEFVDINKRALTKTRLDFSLSKEHKKKLLPSEYIKFNRLAKYFGEHLNVRNEILIFDVSELPASLQTLQKDVQLELISMVLFRVNSFKNFLPVDYCISVGTVSEIHSFISKYNNILPVIEPAVRKELEDAVFSRPNATSICSFREEFDDAQISMLDQYINAYGVEVEITFYNSKYQFVYFVDISFLAHPALHMIYYITEMSLKMLLPEIEIKASASGGKLRIISSDEAEERQLFVGRIASEYFAMKISHLDYENNKIETLAKR